MVIGCFFGASAMLSLGYAEAIFGKDSTAVRTLCTSTGAFTPASDTNTSELGTSDYNHNRRRCAIHHRLCREYG